MCWLLAEQPKRSALLFDPEHPLCQFQMRAVDILQAETKAVHERYNADSQTQQWVALQIDLHALTRIFVGLF